MLLPLLPYSKVANPMVHDDRREVHRHSYLHMIETKPVSDVDIVLPSRARGEDVEEQILKDPTQRCEVAAPVELAGFIIRSTKPSIDGLVNHIRADNHMDAFE